MKKKVLAIVLSVALVAVFAFNLTACSQTVSTMVDDGAGVTISTGVNTTPDLAVGTLTGKSIKIGAIMVGDETEGYTEAHMGGIENAIDAIEAAGGTVTVVWKKKIEETGASCGTAIQECISDGCTLIISNSYGHQDFMATAAKANPSITFIAMTGDYAAITTNGEQLISNFKNAFNDVYESRFVSGVVAGLKLKQLVDDNKLDPKNFDSNNNIRLGYVGAYSYAEVVSGYTAFYLGVKSVVSNVVMTVKYTNSWFNFDMEYTTAKALIAEGCVIIGQHADSEGAPTACEEAYMAGTRVYSVGYNVDMLEAAPHAALTSATNNWAVYYAYALSTAMNSGTIATDWSEGYSKGAVAITAINGKVFTSDPSVQVKAIVDGIVAGTLKVFATDTYTVTNLNTADFHNMGVVVDTNKNVTSYNYDLSYKDWSNGGVVVYQGQSVQTISTGYFNESSFRSAPYFDLRIDGITE